MQPAASCSLVIFTFLCHVQCQHIRFVRDIVASNTTIESLSSLGTGWRHQDGAALPATPVYSTLTDSQLWQLSNTHPSKHNIRSRRQVLYSKNRNSRGGASSWHNSFGFESVTSKPEYLAYIKVEMKRFNSMLKEDDAFQFIKPKGLRFTIRDSSTNTKIKAFRVKKNEEFKDNDGGHYAISGFKRGGLLIYNAPQLKASQGDNIYYLLEVKLGSELKFDATVKGVITITQGDPHTEENTEENGVYTEQSPQSRPSPKPQVVNRWPSEDNIGWTHSTVRNTTYSGSLTQEEEDEFLNALQRFKISLDEDLEFKFFYPRGLSIIIPANTKALTITKFNLKLNEDSKIDSSSDFSFKVSTLSDGRRNLYYHDLKLNPGDKLYYWMVVEWINDVGETIVKGDLDVKRDPHDGQPPGPTKSPPTTTTPPPRKTTPRTPPPPPPPPPTTTASPPKTKPRPPPPPTTTLPPPPSTCSPSPTSTNLNFYTPLCKGHILLDHKFNTLDGWKNQIFIGGKTSDDEFMVFTKDPTNIWLDNGKLVIKPTLLADKYDESFVITGELFLEGCTGEPREQCYRHADHWLILPPIVSARLSTKDKFSFRYGIIELKAKFPRGNWIVPELWLEPVDGPSTERVVMGLSRGNTDDSEYGWRTLEAGLIGEHQSSLGNRTRDNPWSQEFHTFRVEWRPDRIQFFVDNEEIHYVPAENYRTLSKQVHISFGVHVAGNKDFPDSISNKPWKNSEPKRFLTFWQQKKTWYPTWNADSKLEIEYIKVTAI